MKRVNEENLTLAPGLYIVATPIGNLGDITKRALDTLRAVDFIACEDTRVTSKLLQAFLIKKPLIPYHDHNGEKQRPKLEAMIRDGKSIALVSDAGTPLISDPGYKLVAALSEAGHFVTTLPGPSAVTAALTLAGIPTDRFLFLGFPPPKQGARKSWMETEKKTKATLVFYESARRLPQSMDDALKVFGSRRACVCREVSKKFEEVVRGNLVDVAAKYSTEGAPKGEVVVVIEGASGDAADSGSAVNADEMLEKALAYMSVKSASAFVADMTGARKKGMYTKALELSKQEK